MYSPIKVYLDHILKFSDEKTNYFSELYFQRRLFRFYAKANTIFSIRYRINITLENTSWLAKTHLLYSSADCYKRTRIFLTLQVILATESCFNNLLTFHLKVLLQWHFLVVESRIKVSSVLKYFNIAILRIAFCFYYLFGKRHVFFKYPIERSL